MTQINAPELATVKTYDVFDIVCICFYNCEVKEVEMLKSKGSCGFEKR